MNDVERNAGKAPVGKAPVGKAPVGKTSAGKKPADKKPGHKKPGGQASDGQSTEPADGRNARRQRNIDAVLDVVLELFGEESLFPTIEQAATRSGLSLRSLYRYFADPGELLEATVQRSWEVGARISHLPAIGEGPFATRATDFAAMRVRLHGEVGPVYRATVANAAHMPRMRDELHRTRGQFREQFSRQFAPELSAHRSADRKKILAAGDLVTQLDSVDFLRRHRGMSPSETEAVLVATLHSLLT